MSGRCPGLHCPGCGDGGGDWIIAVVVAVAVIGALIHAIWHTIVEAAEIAAVTVLSAAALAAVVGIGVLVHRTRQNHPRQPIATRVVSELPPEPRPQLSQPYKPAIEPLRELHLHRLTPEQIAETITRRGGWTQP